MFKDDSEILCQRIARAYSTKTPLRIVGGQSKNFYANQLLGEPLSTLQHSGVVAYEPSELVITLRSGTPLQYVNEVLAAENQMLAFEPPGFGEHATIGGVVASGLSGPRRPFGGAVRDSVLGCKVVNGKGEVTQYGGQVMKNVAGYDVSRLMVGAMGTLGLLLEISIKVLPKPQQEFTLCMPLSHQEALDVMNARMSKPLPLTAACYDGEIVYLRFASSTRNIDRLRRRVAGEILNDSDNFWSELNEQQHFYFQDNFPIWRLSMASGTLHLGLPGMWFFDWGGALRWYKGMESQRNVRDAVIAEGGHATLFRGRDSVQNAADVDVFQPLPTALYSITKKLKQSFDPQNILNRNRMYHFS